MNPDQRQQLEEHILRRNSGELSPDENAALETTLRDDPEAAEFARFIDCELPAAARAPRDFAAAAIDAAKPERNVIAFPRIWKLTAIAAAIVAGIFLVSQQIAPPPPVNDTQRATERFSARATNIEDELAATRLAYSRGRYSRKSEI